LLAAHLLILFYGVRLTPPTWWGMLLFAALVAAGAVVLRRQTLAEFAPGAPPLGKLRRRRWRTSSPSATLRSEGAISNDEYVRAKELALS